MSFWLNEQKVLTHVRWLSLSTRMSFLIGMLGLIGTTWLFFLFLPQYRNVKATIFKQQALQENIGILTSQLTRYEKLGLLVDKNLGVASSQSTNPVRWVDAFEQIVALLGTENLICKKITMLTDKPIVEIKGKTVEYVFTGRYAHVVSFLEKIQHQFSYMQISYFQIDKAENNGVSTTLRLCLLDV